VADRKTISCCFDDYKIVVLFRIKMYPNTAFLLLSSISLIISSLFLFWTSAFQHFEFDVVSLVSYSLNTT